MKVVLAFPCNFSNYNSIEIENRRLDVSSNDYETTVFSEPIQRLNRQGSAMIRSSELNHIQTGKVEFRYEKSAKYSHFLR